MKIQFNTDENIEGNDRQSTYFGEMISHGLDRFSNQITRLEVHLSDENSDKSGPDDHRCLIEARLEGIQPVSVTHTADTLEHAVKGATDKMKSTLTTIVGRIQEKR